MTDLINNSSSIFPQIDPGITTTDAYELGLLEDELLIQQAVGGTDEGDAYAFSVGEAGEYSFSLSNLTADADLSIYDGEANQVSASTFAESSDEFLKLDLAQGDYYVVVDSYDGVSTNYNLEANFTDALSDFPKFNIEIAHGEGFTTLSPEMVAGLETAAEFWEDAITHSSFAGEHTLTIEVGGTSQGDNILASATPHYAEIDSNGNLLPTFGVSNINTNPEVIEDFNSNIEYFSETMIHEFGHVMGIGTLWEHNNLIDFATATYSADTYTGIAYGELLGSGEATAIPLTSGQGAGSDFSHWSEEVFNNEMMSSTAETPGISEFVSQMTIASLQDMGWNVNYDAAEAYALNSEETISWGTSTEVDSSCSCGFCSSCGGDALSQNLMDIVAMDNSSALI